MKRCRTKRCQTKRCRTKRCRTKRCQRKTRKRGGGRTWFLTAQGRQDHREEKELKRLTKVALQSSDETNRLQVPNIIDMIQFSTLEDIREKLFVSYKQ